MHARRRPILIAVTVLAVLIRLALLAADTHPYDEAGLAADSGNMATNIVAGHGIAENVTALDAIDARQTAEQRLIDPASIAPDSLPRPHYQPAVLEPPGEAVVLAAIWSITGDQRYLPFQVLQAILDSMMVPLVYLISVRLLRRPRAALLAAAAYAVYYPIAVLTRIPHLDIWAGFFTIAITAAWVEALERRRWWPAIVAAGVATGIGVQFRPGVLLLPPMLALATVAWKGWQWALRAGVVAVVITGVLMVPWTVRNENVFHRLIPTRTGVGQNLWEGLASIHRGGPGLGRDRVVGRGGGWV
jgi:Dolichyl-phosphate-mannose-protein mannosyltransferase